MTDQNITDSTPETPDTPESPETAAAESTTTATPQAAKASEAAPDGTTVAAAEPAGAVIPAAAPSPQASGTPPNGHWWWGTGRRKRAIARVRVRPGDGKFFVNKRPHDEYFTELRDRNDITTVLRKTNTLGSVDVHVNVHGGGYTGQAGAIVLGLARALRRYDETLEPVLRDNGFLTRDPRKVERKKYGQPGARRRFQFSKR